MKMQTSKHRKQFINQLWTHQVENPSNTIEEFCTEEINKQIIQNSLQTQGNASFDNKKFLKSYTGKKSVKDYINSNDFINPQEVKLNKTIKFLDQNLLLETEGNRIGSPKIKATINFVGMRLKSEIEHNIQLKQEVKQIKNEQKKDKALITILFQKIESLEQNFCLIKDQNNLQQKQLKDSFNEIQHLQKEFINLDISEKEIYTRPESGFSLDSGVSDIEISDNFDLDFDPKMTNKDPHVLRETKTSNEIHMTKINESLA